MIAYLFIVTLISVVNEENTQYEVRYKYIPPTMTLEQFLNGIAQELSFPTERLFFYYSHRRYDLLVSFEKIRKPIYTFILVPRQH